MTRRRRDAPPDGQGDVPVVYRGPAHRLVVGPHELLRDGPPVAIPWEVYERLRQDHTVRLEVVGMEAVQREEVADEPAV